jgi:hypothetical protein
MKMIRGRREYLGEEEAAAKRVVSGEDESSSDARVAREERGRGRGVND